MHLFDLRAFSLSVATLLLLRECAIPWRYFVTEEEKHSSFTGREQRNGVWILAFLIDGSSDKGRPRDLSGKGAATGRREDAEATAQRLLRSFCNEEDVTDSEEGSADDQTEEERDDQELRAGSRPVRFDWGPYRAVVKHTPLLAAITAMLAEYALLVGRVTRRLGAAAVTPVTLGEGASMAEQARNFILHCATPILGTMGTTKGHRLLYHILQSVRYRGSIPDENTSANESRHKADKRHYKQAQELYASVGTARPRGRRRLEAQRGHAPRGGGDARHAPSSRWGE